MGRRDRNDGIVKEEVSVLGRPGDDLLSHVLRQSTIGAKAFDGRVRDGIGSYHLAKATRPAKNGEAKLVIHVFCFKASALKVSRLSDESNQVERAISTSKLHASPRFHTWPINVMVYHGSRRSLVLRQVSRLDAFSGYLFHT